MASGPQSLHGTAHGAPAVIEQRDPIVIVRGRCVDTTMQRLVLALLFLVHVVLVGAARGKHALLKSHLNSQAILERAAAKRWKNNACDDSDSAKNKIRKADREIPVPYTGAC